MARKTTQKDRYGSGPFTEDRSSKQAHRQYRRYQACGLTSRKPNAIRAQLPADMHCDIKHAVSLTVARLEKLAKAGGNPPGLKLDYPSLDGGYSTFLYMPAEMAKALAADVVRGGDMEA